MDLHKSIERVRFIFIFIALFFCNDSYDDEVTKHNKPNDSKAFHTAEFPALFKSKPKTPLSSKHLKEPYVLLYYIHFDLCVSKLFFYRSHNVCSTIYQT